MGVIDLLAITYSLIIIIPLYYVFISSFKSNIEIFTCPLGLPSYWSLDNFFKAQEQVNILGAIFVSAQIVLASEILCLILGFLAAYSIARFQVREVRWVEIFFGAGFLVPVFALLVPVFLLAARLHLLYNPIYLVFFYAASRLPLTVILLADLYPRDSD